MQPYTLYVMSLSPYSDKIRMYLALKRLPVVEVRENLRNREQVLRARTGRTMVPVVITPDDRALKDSTAIVRALEAERPEPPLLSADAGRRGFDALVEDYADEWIVRAMLAPRWLHPADAEQERIVIDADMTCGAFGVDMATAKELFPRGITATLPAMGATPEALDFLLDDVRGLCGDLDGLFGAHRFLGGAEPSVGDLALYGQLNQIRRDPTGAGIVADPRRPSLARWFRDVERRAEGEAAEHPGTAPPIGTCSASSPGSGRCSTRFPRSPARRARGEPPAAGARRPPMVGAEGQRSDVRAVFRALRRPVSADAGSPLPLPLAPPRRCARSSAARPRGERLRVPHGGRRHREDDAPARVSRRARAGDRRCLRLQSGPLARRAAADAQRRVRAARDEREPEEADRRPQRPPAGAARGGPALRGGDRRGAGAQHRGPRAAPAPLEPRDHHREAATHHRRPAPAPGAPA